MSSAGGRAIPPSRWPASRRRISTTEPPVVSEIRYGVQLTNALLEQGLVSEARPVFERLREEALGQRKTRRAALAARPDCALLELRHADVLADPLAAAGEINTFLALDIDIEAMATVVDSELCHHPAPYGQISCP